MAQITKTKGQSFSPDWRFQEPVAWRDTDLDEKTLREWFRYMLLGRQIDYRFQVLNRQGRAPFIISCAGHEAAQIGVSWPLKPKHDWLAPYYRDVVLCMRMGMTPLDLMLSVLAKAADPASGGKQTPGHFSDSRHNITSGGSPVATQMVRGAGVAYALKMDGTDKVLLTCYGEGAGAEGDAHEAFNFAAIYKLPEVFVCENNGFAISTPFNKEYAIEHVAQRAAGDGLRGSGSRGRAEERLRDRSPHGDRTRERRRDRRHEHGRGAPLVSRRGDGTRPAGHGDGRGRRQERRRVPRHRRIARPFRRGARDRHPARRVIDRGCRARPCHRGQKTGRRDAVHRLRAHGLQLDHERDREVPLPQRRRLVGAARGACADGRTRAWRALSLAVDRGALRNAGIENRDPVDALRGERAPARRDPRPRPGPLLRAQAAVSHVQGSGAEGRVSDPAAGRAHRARRNGHLGVLLRADGPLRDRGGQEPRSRRRER